MGGPIGLVQEGDEILIDVNRRKIELRVHGERAAGAAQAAGSRCPRRCTTGYLARYARAGDLRRAPGAVMGVTPTK